MILLCLVFLWFCPFFQFLLDFSLFLWIVLDYFCCWFVRYVRSFSLLCFFGLLNSLSGIISANSNPLFISVVGYPLWCRVVCSTLRRVFKNFYPWLLYVVYVLECKGRILYRFWDGGFWSRGIVGGQLVCGRYLWWFSHSRFFIKMSRNGNSFELCSIVNFILGCRFCSGLCDSLMSRQGHFPEYEAFIQVSFRWYW